MDDFIGFVKQLTFGYLAKPPNCPHIGSYDSEWYLLPGIHNRTNSHSGGPFYTKYLAEKSENESAIEQPIAISLFESSAADFGGDGHAHVRLLQLS